MAADSLIQDVDASPAARREAFAALLAEFEPALRRLTAGYVTEADRDDLFQEIAVALWTALPQFRGNSSARTWVYRVAHNIAITYRAKKRRRWFGNSDGLDVADSRPEPESQALALERRKRMMRLIRSLPGLERQLLLLHLEGLSHEEIGSVAGLSAAAVGKRISRIRQKLASRLEATENKR